MCVDPSVTFLKCHLLQEPFPHVPDGHSASLEPQESLVPFL